MRYFEIVGGLRVPMSSEESEVLTASKEGLMKNKASERQWEVGRQMVNKGLLTRIKKDDEECVIPNEDPPLKRS